MLRPRLDAITNASSDRAFLMQSFGPVMATSILIHVIDRYWETHITDPERVDALRGAMALLDTNQSILSATKIKGLLDRWLAKDVAP